MIIAKNAIQPPNHEQVPVIAIDQPLYATAKQIQWSCNWPDLGEKSFLNQARAGQRLAHAWFLKIDIVRTSVCMCVSVCVCPSGY